ncbi:hypothetical protein BLNAU_24682 [Blattamonas nauphoetae]|uniref:Uncharacterized protein n=1 Tax=Blattamonas nauphoetae TaxID=2049346 RepID=A0ABQ9WLQ8_9EUKA|nr:hypothetical protein BLNAU_24682 [Blattamonas nauphoetae]
MLSSSSLLNVTSKRTPLLRTRTDLGWDDDAGCELWRRPSQPEHLLLLLHPRIERSRIVFKQELHKTQRFNYAAGSTTTSATFTLCTFKDMTAKSETTLGLSDPHQKRHVTQRLAVLLPRLQRQRATRTSDNTLIPQITSTPTIDTCKVTFSGATATVTVTTKEVIGGAMEILLEGCLVPRLVYVQFSVNERIQQSGQRVCHLERAGFFRQPLSLRSFALPGDVDANTTTMTVTGVTLLEGLYSMLVQSDGLNDSDRMLLFIRRVRQDD